MKDVNDLMQAILEMDAAQRKARKYFETLFEANGYTASVDFKP